MKRPTTSDLRGRQSVRATFKLSAGCIDAISIVAAHLGIKQKSLFDHLVEDTESLKSIAENVKQAGVLRKNRIQKTYVISRKSLVSLDEISRSFNTPRDALVEFSVKRLLPIIKTERKRHRLRKAIRDEVRRHFRQGNDILKRAREMLGDDDPIVQKLSAMMGVYQNAQNYIEAYIEKGSIIEQFDAEVLEGDHQQEENR